MQGWIDYCVRKIQATDKMADGRSNLIANMWGNLNEYDTFVLLAETGPAMMYQRDVISHAV